MSEKEEMDDQEVERYREIVADCSPDYKEYMSARTIRKFLARIASLKAEVEKVVEWLEQTSPVGHQMNPVYKRLRSMLS